MRSRGGGANEGNSGEVVTVEWREVVTGSKVVTGGRERVTAGQLACEVLEPEQAGDIIAGQGSSLQTIAFQVTGSAFTENLPVCGQLHFKYLIWKIIHKMQTQDFLKFKILTVSLWSKSQMTTYKSCTIQHLSSARNNIHCKHVGAHYVRVIPEQTARASESNVW